MGSALSSGVTGLQAHQKMLEVAGNNLANINTTAFKSSSIGFSELLSETISRGSAPSGSVGGTNPQQLGSGVGVASVTRNMTQGGFESTGQNLDMAIAGEGYFVMDTGNQIVYTRVGSFAVDANSQLVDPATGYKVQRIGSAGEADGFQVLGDSAINIPFDAAMPAQATSSFNLSGNLRAEGGTQTTTTLAAGTVYVLSDGITKSDVTTRIDALDQFSGTPNAADTITITGTGKDGTAVSHTWIVPAAATLGDLIAEINSAAAFDSGSADGATATLLNGEIRLEGNSAGYSLLDMNVSYAAGGGGDAALETPGYFEMLEVGGEDSSLTAIDIYDAMGGKHTLSGAFVKSDTIANSWDFVLTKLTGEVSQLVDRRISNINFRASDGAFQGISDTNTAFDFKFSNDPSTTQTIEMSYGTTGMFDGLTQFKTGEATATASNQDGFTAGQLASISSSNGEILGTFSNGVKKTIATIKLGVFQNAAGLESAGQGYFVASANSGDPIGLMSGRGSAGLIQGQKLEKSNVQVAEQFVTMIQAQNGFQANARTISVANEVLRELTNLIR